jgi:hypothetical protein
MFSILLNKHIVSAILVIALSGQSVLANKNMYRWVDDNGDVFYSDQVSPKDIKHRRESLNQNIRVVNVIEKQKTKAQRELAKRLILLRKQQESIINKQKSHDKVLLSTYRSIEDMLLALKGQMLALDGKRKIVRSNLNRLELQLQTKQKKAAQYERDGRRIPLNLLTDIATARQQINDTYVEIANQFQKKKRIRENFENDIARFSFLIESKKKERDFIGYLTAKDRAANELGLFVCETIRQCDHAWVSAKQFVRTYSTVPLDIETDTLIMGQTPYKDTDLSLSISKMDEADGSQQLFLDIRCRRSSLGDLLCRGQKVKKIRQLFNEFIKSTLPEEKE